MNEPLVSVIIPTYNRAATLRRTVDSALAQTYQPLEVIVVDDGSTDTSGEVIASYGDRIRSVRRANGGPSAARNTGMEVAEGEWLAFLDSDDVWLPEKISRQVRLVASTSGRVVCCMCNAAIIDGDGVSRTTTFDVSGVRGSLAEGYWLNPAPLLATRFILFNQVALIHREAFRQVGGFKPGLRLLEDYDLAFRLSRLGPWAFVGDPLVEKYNDTDGIGVVAMAEPMAHCTAWRNVIEGFLKEGAGDDAAVGGLLRRALADVITEMRLLEMRESSGVAGCVAWAGMLALHKLQGLRRRMPSWPRPVERDALLTVP